MVVNIYDGARQKKTTQHIEIVNCIQSHMFKVAKKKTHKTKQQPCDKLLIHSKMPCCYIGYTNESHRQCFVGYFVCPVRPTAFVYGLFIQRLTCNI